MDLNYNVQRAFPCPGKGPLCCYSSYAITTNPPPEATQHARCKYQLPTTLDAVMHGSTASLAENVTGMLPVMVRLRGKEDRAAPRTTAHCPTRQHNHQPCSLAFGSQWSKGVICAWRTCSNPHHGGLSCQQAMLHRPLTGSAQACMVIESKLVKGVPCNIAYPNTMSPSSTRVCRHCNRTNHLNKGRAGSCWWQRGHPQHSVCQHTPHKGVTGCVQPAVSCNCMRRGNPHCVCADATQGLRNVPAAQHPATKAGATRTDQISHL